MTMQNSTTISTSNINILSLHAIKIKRSLIISPSLDALLEHEEKTRVQTPSIFSELTTSGHSSRSVSPSEEFLVDLPLHLDIPDTSTPNSSLSSNLLPSGDTGLHAQGTHEKLAYASIFVKPTSSSASNPYINPAPSLAELFVDIPSKAYLTKKCSTKFLSQPRPYYGEQFSEPSSHRSDSRDKLPIITASSWSPSGQQSRPPGSHVVKLRVSSSPYSNRNVGLPIRNSEHNQGLNRIAQALSSHLRQVHKRGKPQDMKDTGISSKIWSSASIDSDWRLRPLNSHVKHPSSSFDSMNTFSLYEPVTTTEMSESDRNSISSTEYPPSHSHSRHYSLYNGSALSLTKNKQNRDSDIETYSLSNTEYSTSLDLPQLSPLQFSKLSLSEYSLPSIPLNLSSTRSSKPPLPTTPKPVFSRTGLTRQAFPKYPKTSQALLSPTTNFLDARERADLVRKTHKLARVFGQTPRADAMAHQEKSRQGHLDWLTNGARRHSAPFSPRDLTFMDVSPHLSPSGNQASHARVQTRSESPMSFIDLSDSDDSFDGGDTALVTDITRSLPSSPAQSQFEKMFEEEQADEDRRRKRERLAKLHRFLGSRVPINLVLGIDNVEASLPSPYRSPTSGRVKEELNHKEKLINVRRAVKMEKVFGVAPPQTLYHTRPPEVGTVSSPASPLTPKPAYLEYMSKKNHRLTSESNMLLLAKDQQTFDDLADTTGSKHSTIYDDYRYSLNSLHDILDRDDRESLVELHQYLNAKDNPSLQPEVSPVAMGHRMSNASSIKSGRRRSFPTRTSSFDSEYSVTSPEANVTTFQVRRRRAAKLTQFFGVDYRELISDILQSIENGVEHEHENGTLCAEEVADLLSSLRTLKTKRQSFVN